MIDFTVKENPSIQRFKTGIEYQKRLLNLTRSIQQRMLNNLPSNYSKDQNTNLAEFFRVVSKEFSRLQMSISDVNENKYHDTTQAEYLFQILGDSLFLGDKAINENLDDISYRNFLIRVRNAYFLGSRKDNIETSVSDLLGLPVILKEVYLNLREEGSSYGLEDTHKMFFDIIMDEAGASSLVGILLEDIKFFIDLIKPAHVIYNTRLIWNDRFKNKNGRCKPSYITQNMEYEVYGSSMLYMITYLASKIYKYSGTDLEETWEEGIISSVDYDKGIFYLQDETILVYNSSTKLYERDGQEDKIVLPTAFIPGNEIRYYADKDSYTTSDIIDNTWLYSGIVSDIFPDEELIYLDDGSIIVYNEDTLVYTRDYNGEYRITILDIIIGKEIAIKADKYIKSFMFYITPEEVEENFFKQFDSNLMKKSTFQEYVKKNKAIPEGLEEGYQIVIEEGVAIIKNIKSNFYKRDGAVNYKPIIIDKYSLFINNEFQQQFIEDDPNRSLTLDEAKQIFINSYGYTGIQDQNTNYEIIINRTGKLIPNGSSSILEAIGNQTELCDQRASCQLNTYYEDTRKYYTWPDIQLTSGFFNITHEFEVTDPPEGAFDVGAWYYLSSDPNIYIMPYLPMLNNEAQPADVSDIVVYLNGRLINNAVVYIDPWNGIIGLNFIPPFDSKLRIDYYYSKRYPDRINYIKQIKGELPLSVEGDLPALLTVVNSGGIVPRLTWPFEISNTDLYGNDLDYQMDKFPILNQRGELATADEIDVQVGTVIVSGTVRVIDLDIVYHKTTIESIDSNWINVEDGDTIILSIPNYLDNTHIYTIESVDIISDTCIVPNLLPQLGASYSYIIIKFIDAPGAVTDVRPLLGHIKINFLPPVNSYIRFDYYYTSQKRNYLMIPDASVASGPEYYEASQYTPDTFYSSRDRYTMLVDQNPLYADQPYWDFSELLKIGYRYRAFTLYNSSVLNSERFIFDDYDKNGGHASFNHGPSNLDRYGLMFSPEYIYDTDKNIKFNDKYLTKNLTPVTILNSGTPPFVKTFTDNGHHKNFLLPEEEDTYDSDFDGGKDLKASFTIIEPDNSGIIDYNSICDFKEKERINLYSDLKIVEKPNNGYDAPLSTIDEAGTSIPFRFVYIDHYYPDRELRINDYLDYINQVPTEIRTGEINVLNGSNYIKSKSVNFRSLNIGDQITVKSVPFIEWDKITSQYITVYKNLDYILIEIIDFETGKFHKPFKGKSGQYNYELVRSKTYSVDVGLAGGYDDSGTYYGNLNRIIVLKNDIDFDYGLPPGLLASFPEGYSINFPDPDVDPYPRNPDNPWISNPTVAYYDIEPYVIDGNITITNRTKGVTGIINTSQIIDAEGKYMGVTGMTGVTGPSGALDLGITGPVEYANPRNIDEYDVYQVPSGDSGIYFSYSEAEYRIQWRNWDQDMMIVNFTPSGVVEEDPINMMDDIGDNILLSFWNVSTSTIRELRFSGTLVYSSEKLFDSELATSFPNGLILLNIDQRYDINLSSNPISDFPEYHLNDIHYQINRLIIRELQHDDLFKITEIQQLIPIIL